MSVSVALEVIGNGSLTLYLDLILTEDRSDKICIALGTLSIIVGRSKLDKSIRHLTVSGLDKDR